MWNIPSGMLALADSSRQPSSSGGQVKKSWLDFTQTTKGMIEAAAAANKDKERRQKEEGISYFVSIRFRSFDLEYFAGLKAWN